MKFVFGPLAIIIGAIMVIKTEWFLENFGSISWAEEHLGTEGGSRLAYKLMGLTLIIGSLMIMTNVLQAIMLSIFAPMFGVKAP